MTINAKKTKTIQVLHQRGKLPYNRTSFRPYEAVDEFKYLGTTINSNDNHFENLSLLKKEKEPPRSRGRLRRIPPP